MQDNLLLISHINIYEIIILYTFDSIIVAVIWLGKIIMF